ncbi:MAG: DNA internalization-related competence protein ComEC/Rec2, partial [Gammaproteobacteria bacterium]
MWLQSVSFAVGVLLCQQLTNLPGWFFSLVSLAVLLTFIVLYLEDFSSWAITIFWLLIGFFWSVLSAHWTLADKLPENLIKQPLEVVGVIADLPERHGKDWRFNFRIDQASYLGEPVKIPKKVRLSWYRTSQAISSGQTWHLQVKLKPPSGLRNFGLFDLEGWYFQHNIRARGYVLDSEKNRLVKPAGVLNFDSWREKLRENLERYGGASNAVAMTKALTLGDKSQISREDWQIFQRLGINHLVAISGLHIGIISLLAYGVSGRLWRLSARLCEKVAAPQVQAFSGLVFAIGYAGLAGFSLPTQRALVMIAILLLSRLLLVNMQPYRQFFLALLVVLIWQPSAIISAGFWLSFVAVAAIFYVLHFSADSSTFVRLIKMQLVISLALMPLTLWFFQQVSVISPLVNLVLIPLFSFLIVPAALLTALLSFLDHPWIDFLIQGYFQVLEYFLDHLALLATPDWLVIEFPGLTGAQYFLIFAIVSVGFLRFKSKLKLPLWLGCGLLLPITNVGNENGAMKLTVLDVGQGSAYLVETSNKVLLYDLGPRYGSGSATRSVVIPYLKNRGLTAIDTVVISHADSDHAGDVRSLLAVFKVDVVLVGETV